MTAETTTNTFFTCIQQAKYPSRGFFCLFFSQESEGCVLFFDQEGGSFFVLFLFLVTV